MDQLEDAYDTIASAFSETRAVVWGEFLFVKKLITDGQNIVDVGCGNGRFMQLVGEKKVSYTGIDNSAKLLEKAQAFASGFPNVKSAFIKGSMLEIPLKDNSFDLALCIATLHHIPSQELRQKAVQELWRILKPGGILILSNWYLLGVKKYLFQQLIQRIQKPGLYGGCGVRDFFIPWNLVNEGKIVFRYYYAFTKKELLKLLNQAGFDLETVSVSMSEPDWSGKRLKRNIIMVAKKK